MKPEQATFYATIPNIASAIRVHGESGGRIQLDISDSELAEALRLVAWREKLLKITIEVTED